MISQEQYNDLIDELKNNDAELIAVSKFQPLSKIQALYDWGHRDFGENYVQELVDKQASLPADIRWHFIGHLQRNKVKYIAPIVQLIQTVDSYKLLLEINKCAEQNQKVIDILLQLYIGIEETKYGLNTNELLDLLSIYDQQKDNFRHIRIRGLMGMATNTEDEAVVKNEFQEMVSIFSNMKQQFFLGQAYFDTLSMGMSNDYVSALEAGSTMIRVGSTIFGNR